MIAEQLSLVRFAAEKVHRRLPPGVALEALVHAGAAGMLQAVEHGKSRPRKLSSAYAKYRIQSEIMVYLRSLDWVGQAVRTWGRNEARARRHLSVQLAREAKHDEIAAELNVSLEEYQRIMEHHDDSQFLTRHELAVSSAEEWSHVQEKFFVHPAQDPLLFLRKPAMLEMVQEVLRTLPEQEQLVMSLTCYEEMTPQEISEILGITEGHVSQIHRAVTARLRQCVQETREKSSRSLGV
jgi:RNA polymerase sigma factor for flagellar operon FliA